MPEDNTQSTGADASGAADQQQHHEPPKTFTQEELNKLLADEKRTFQKREKELKSKADEWDRYQESKKTQEQQLQEKYATLEKEHNSLKASVELGKARSRFGRKYGIPEADWDRLHGSTSEEIEEDARTWAKSRGLDKAGGPTPKGGSGATRGPFNQAFLDAIGRGGR